MNKITLLLFIVSLLTMSCGVPQSDYDILRKENEKLKKEIEECQFNASEFLSQAEEANEKLQYKKSKKLLELLLTKHPRSKEAKAGKKLLEKVSKDIALTDKELERDKLIEDSNNVLGQMRKRIDKNSGATFYTDKTSSPKNTENIIYLYAGTKAKSKPWLGVAVNFFSSSAFLYVQKIMINADGKIFNIEEEKLNEFKYKKEPRGYREWIDQLVNEEDINAFRMIAQSDTVVLTLIGKEISHKRTITPAEKRAMLNVLYVYKILGG